MDKVNQDELLNANISLLEQKRTEEFKLLRQQLHVTGESLKPANLIKGAVQDITGSSKLKGVLLKAAVGLAIGFVTKKIVNTQLHQAPSEPRNASKEMLGNLLQYGISFLMANRNGFIKSAGIYLVNHLVTTYKKRRKKRKQFQNGIAYTAASPPV